MRVKTCTKCKRVKRLDKWFHRARASKDGYHWYCKPCNTLAAKSSLEELPLAVRIYKRTKARAKLYGILFTIQPSDITIVSVCPYFGFKLRYTRPAGGKHLPPNAATLDRIDPTKGYVPGNIRVICHLANKMKNSATEEELIVFANAVLRLHS